MHAREALWWQNGVVYEIYPRSFADSNRDGVGDLEGIRRRLDYLAWLGIDAIWVAPFYPSPMADFGYDVADHTAVDPLFGSLADFDALLEAAHRRGIRVIVDFVPNHTSDQHPWFQDALEHCQDSVYYDWYRFNEDCTAYDSFFGIAELPELNLDNPDTRTYFLDEVVPFYLDADYTHPGTAEQGLGFDGFRLDYALGPSMDFWAAFRDAVAATDPDAYIFGEVWASRSTIAGFQDVFVVNSDGTNVTPPESGTVAATSAESATASISPSPSRSHSTAPPAESMTACRPNFCTGHTFIQMPHPR
jgi:glycosidase